MTRACIAAFADDGDWGLRLEGIALAVIVAGAVAGIFWLFGALRRWGLRSDRAWLERHFESRGEELLAAQLRHFVRGAMADAGVHYDVRYRDVAGQEHTALCFIASPSRTIHLSEDEVVDAG